MPQDGMEPISSKPNNFEALDELYKAHAANPQHDSMNKFLAAVNPYIDDAVRKFGGGYSTHLKSTAKILIAKNLHKYDPNQKVPIKNWIYSQLQPLIRERGEIQSIPVPERVRQDLFELKNAEGKLTEQFGREPSILELSDKLGISPTRIQRLRKYNVKTLSSSSFVNEEGAYTPPGIDEPAEHSIWLDYVYHDMAPMERLIFDRIQQGKSKRQIADELRITPAAVTQKTKNIAIKFKEILNSKNDTI